MSISPPQRGAAAHAKAPVTVPIASIDPPQAMSHKRHVVCMYKYQPLPEHSLSLIHNGLSPVAPLALNKGDVVFATDRHKSGWWFGERWQPGCKTSKGNEMGWFPIAHTSGHKIRFGSIANTDSGAIECAGRSEGSAENGRDVTKRDRGRLVAVEEDLGWGKEEEEEEDGEEGVGESVGDMVWKGRGSMVEEKRGSGDWRVIALDDFPMVSAAVMEGTGTPTVFDSLSSFANEMTKRRQLLFSFSQWSLASFLSRDFRSTPSPSHYGFLRSSDAM